MARPDAVLITRPAAEAEFTAVRVRERGFTAVLAPLLSVMPMTIEHCAADGIVVTSGNALPAIGAFSCLPLLAVGDATAARARRSGFQSVVSAGGDAGALAAMAPRCFPVGARLLFATAEGEGASLAQNLRAAGFVVDHRIAYSVHPVTELPNAGHLALVNRRLRAALFLSARTARTFVSVLDPALQCHLTDIDALVIGQPAADVLTPLPWRQVRVSLAPTLDQMLALL